MVRATAREAISARAPLTLDIASALADAWTHGSYADLGDAAIDVVVRHVREHGFAAMDRRVADAIADAIALHVERAGDAPRAAQPPRFSPQLTLDDALRDHDELDAGDRIVALRFADGSPAIRPIGGVA